MKCASPHAFSVMKNEHGNKIWNSDVFPWGLPFAMRTSNVFVVFITYHCHWTSLGNVQSLVEQNNMFIIIICLGYHLRAADLLVFPSVSPTVTALPCCPNLPIHHCTFTYWFLGKNIISIACLSRRTKWHLGNNKTACGEKR